MNQSYKYVVFSPYFGKLPFSFDLFVSSCQKNTDFLFMVFTDCQYTKPLPNNVCIKQMSFEQLQKLVQSKFDFPIALSYAYKLCDYKPAFGYIFSEYLEDCLYWGYCDMDLVFGDIAKFLPTQHYDKISHLGHLCLYKNTPNITMAFQNAKSQKLTYKDIFASDTHFAFDEYDDYGINPIFRENNFSIYPFEKDVADIDSLFANFTFVHYQNDKYAREKGKRIFSFENGKVYSHTLIDDKINCKEYAYVHFQKRILPVELTENTNSFLITPLGIKPMQKITAELIKQHQYKYEYWKNLKRIIQVKSKSTPRALCRLLSKNKIMRNKEKRG